MLIDIIFNVKRYLIPLFSLFLPCKNLTTLLMNLLFVAIGSMFGGVSRYWLSGIIQKNAHTLFPLGVLSVNIIGCFIIGLLAGLSVHTNLLTQNHRLFLIIGFCGSFTTFSSFSLDNLKLVTTKAYFLFSLNIGLSVILGLLATWLGYYLMQTLFRQLQ